MRPEQRFWSRLKDKEAIPGSSMRVENSACDGTPDVNACDNGNEYWVELKVGLRRNLIRRSGKQLLKKTQPPWHLKRVMNGGKVFVLLQEPKYIMVLFKVVFAYDVMDMYKEIIETKNYTVIHNTLTKEIGSN